MANGVAEHTNGETWNQCSMKRFSLSCQVKIQVHEKCENEEAPRKNPKQNKYENSLHVIIDSKRIHWTVPGAVLRIWNGYKLGFNLIDMNLCYEIHVPCYLQQRSSYRSLLAAYLFDVGTMVLHALL